MRWTPKGVITMITQYQTRISNQIYIISESSQRSKISAYKWLMCMSKNKKLAIIKAFWNELNDIPFSDKALDHFIYTFQWSTVVDYLVDICWNI
jgi:hypothetical protein